MSTLRYPKTDRKQLPLRFDEKTELHGKREGSHLARERGRTRIEFLQHDPVGFGIARVTHDVVGKQFGPSQQRRVDAPAALVGKRLCGLADAFGPFLEHGE